MPIYLISAKPMHNQQGQVIPAPAGCVGRMILILPGAPGAYSGKDVGDYMAKYQLGTRGIAYEMLELNPEAMRAPLVVTELALGNGMRPQPAQPQLSQQHVQGGMPTGTPQPQGGAQPRLDGQRDVQTGFQTLGDPALDGGVDAVYGTVDDHTVSDIIVSGAGPAQEHMR